MERFGIPLPVNWSSYAACLHIVIRVLDYKKVDTCLKPPAARNLALLLQVGRAIIRCSCSLPHIEFLHPTFVVRIGGDSVCIPILWRTCLHLPPAAHMPQGSSSVTLHEGVAELLNSRDGSLSCKNNHLLSPLCNNTALGS